MKLHSRLIRQTSRAAENWRVMVRSNKDAVETYRTMTDVDPARAITPTMRRDIRDYAKDELGSIKHAPWLEVIAGWRGEFVRGCLPETYALEYVVPYSLQPHGKILDKTIAAKVLATDRLPDIGYIIKGTLFDRDFNPVDPDAFAKSTFANHPYIYLKKSLSYQGLAVSRVTSETFASEFANCTNASLQYPLDMHEDLEALSPSAAATLRVITISHKGNIRAVAAHLRVGKLNDTHILSASNIVIAVDLNTGKLFEIGKDSGWRPKTSHPDTGVIFAGLVYPQFHDSLEMVKQHHARLPHIGFIGWDMAVTKSDGPMLFEANAGYPSTMWPEANHGPIFAGLGWDKLHLKS